MDETVSRAGGRGGDPERVTNISMGSELDNVTEFEDVADSAIDAPTETCFMKYE